MTSKNVHHISSKDLTLENIQQILSDKKKLDLSKESKQLIDNCYKYLHKKIKASNQSLYGINTGFGYLQNIKIDSDQTSDLQKNLLLSHACGTGEIVPEEVINIMLLLKIHSLSYGHSGVKLDTVLRLIEMFNLNILPIIYTQGSLGASGDLCPLSHLALPLIGEGYVIYKGKRIQSSKLLKELKLTPIALEAKESLALINGTQFMSAYLVNCLILAEKMLNLADLISSLSLDAFSGKLEPFHPNIHSIRAHRGQVDTAKIINNYLQGSKLQKTPKEHLQDPYSFRCIAQVHGATKDLYEYCKKTLLIEINSVSDNPNIFSNEDLILSGGNFHGQPLAFAADFLTIAMAELGNISERRTFQLLSGTRGLPLFLAKDPGLNSGLMIPQYTAAAIVSENKQLSTPSSVDSIVSSNGQEDHVSMGANAVVKCHKVLENVKKILAIELLTAAQALDFRRPLTSSKKIEQLMKQFRAEVTFNKQDRYLAADIEKSITFIEKINLESYLNR